MSALTRGRRDQLEVKPKMWARRTAHRRAGRGRTALVGDPETVAEREEGGCGTRGSTPSSVGLPPIEEAYSVAELSSRACLSPSLLATARRTHVVPFGEMTRPKRHLPKEAHEVRLPRRVRVPAAPAGVGNVTARVDAPVPVRGIGDALDGRRTLRVEEP